MKKTMFAAALTLLSLAAWADTLPVDKTHSNVEFKVRHLTSNVRGRFTDFDGTINVDPAKPTAGTVSFTIKAASIDTNEPKRDAHLRSEDFFDAAKYPEITFKSTSIKPAGKDRYDVTGTLTMRGVSRQIVLPVTFLGWVKDPWGNTKGGFELETKLNRKDYNIVWNKALDNGGVLLGEDVSVFINLEVAKPAPQPAATGASK